MQSFGKEEILRATLIILLAITNKGYIESRLNKKRIYDKLDIIDDIFIYINTHMSEEITLDDLAKELIEKNIPIIEVYSKCGFGGYTHFFRAFKKEFGITPRQYYHKAVNSKK